MDENNTYVSSSSIAQLCPSSTGQNVGHVLNLGHGTLQGDNLARVIGACLIESHTFVTFFGLGVPVSSISCFKYAFGEFRHSVVR